MGFENSILRSSSGCLAFSIEKDREAALLSSGMKSKEIRKLALFMDEARQSQLLLSALSK